jgi:amino acid transporter
MDALNYERLPWNELAATYASWMKWPVIVASVSSMFAVMLASNNGIVRILHKMGREGLLPGFFGHIDPKRRTPIYAVLFQGVFAVGLAFIVGGLAGGLGDSVAGASVYGYLGFLLTMGILPVYILTNAAAIRFFRGRGDFNPLRHLVLPGLGALLMIGLTVGQVVEQVEAPYTWFPWVIVGWVVLASAGALWLGFSRPDSLSSAGAVMGSVDDVEEEPDLALGVA